MYSRYEQRRNCCGPRTKGAHPKAGGQVARPEKVPPPSPPQPCPQRSTGEKPRPMSGPLPTGFFPPALSGLLSGSSSGDLMALMILLLLLWEGKEDSRGTILTLLIFLLL